MEILGMSICTAILTFSAIVWRFLSMMQKQKDKIEEDKNNEWEALKKVDDARDTDIPDPVNKLRAAKRLRKRK